jgi:hypothetical protein
VANERMQDALSLMHERANSVGPVYLAGYAIECSLKALLQREGCGFPVSGSEGHNLRTLWRTTGLVLRDIGDKNGFSSFYIESWCTDLRYEAAGEFPGTCDEMLTGAKVLVSLLQTKLRRKWSRRLR